MTRNADSRAVTEPDGARRVYAFARALGLTVDQLVALLESYDLHILSGRYLPLTAVRGRRDPGHPTIHARGDGAAGGPHPPIRDDRI